jgi:5'-deoxynucleotidase YfbR-like HD superfamily hydrolase
MTIRDDPRMAGNVLRWHTWPVSRNQTNAEHQWNVARIVLAINPGASRELIMEAMFHDLGEIATGDPPYPIKRENPRLKEEMDRLETDTRRTMVLPWSLPPQHPLTVFETWVLKLADCIETWEFALEEIMRGNRFCDLVERRNRENIVVMTVDHMNSSGVETSMGDVSEATMHYMKRRLDTWQQS